ncbi:MAG: hypothetical protein FWE03_07135 [Firmicutes bacterium]|nr:hypothetical protein [Bacillota bacterium]
MKKTTKIFSVTLIIAVLLASSFMLSACGGGANDPERAARNFLNAISSQNANRLANVFGLAGEPRETFIENWEEQTAAPDRNTRPDQHREFTARNREFSSINFSSFTGRTVAAVDTATTGRVAFSFRYNNSRGEYVRVTREVTLHFNRGESGRWYSSQGNITAVMDAMDNERS